MLTLILIATSMPKYLLLIHTFPRSVRRIKLVPTPQSLALSSFTTFPTVTALHLRRTANTWWPTMVLTTTTRTLTILRLSSRTIPMLAFHLSLVCFTFLRLRETVTDHRYTEPDSLANLVTNLNVAKCQEAQPAYEAGVAYAIKTLNFPNVASYLDAGHAGWLGWPANIGPAADLFAKVYKAAGSPSSVRGLATNVANYNSWDIATAPSYTQGNKNFNEKLYINALAPLLTAAGYPAHFVVDVGRNGVQPTQQQEWGHWCNVKGTGFGVRPTTNTGDPLVDSFVWIKPGGECDGTSNSSAVRYDAHCGYSDALQPAPEAGQWFQAYFQQLLQNANPAFT